MNWIVLMIADIARATLEWAAADQPQSLRYIERNYRHWEPSPRRDEAIKKELVALYMSERIGVSVEKLSNEGKGRVDLVVRGDIEESDLFRLMTVTVVNDDAVMAFYAVGSEVQTSSEEYMGDVSDCHSARLVFKYRVKERQE